MPRESRSRRERIAFWVVSLIAVGLASGLVVVVATAGATTRAAERPVLQRAATDWGGSDETWLSADHREVAGAAREEALALLTVDYRDMDRHIDAVLEGATGGFADDFRGRIDSLVSTSTRQEATSTGEILAVGVGDLDGDRATAFVAANGRVTSRSTGGREQVRPYRLQFELVRDAGRWLVSRVQFVK